jgi:hypothetical protein
MKVNLVIVGLKSLHQECSTDSTAKNYWYGVVISSNFIDCPPIEPAGFELSLAL